MAWSGLRQRQTICVTFGVQYMVFSHQYPMKRTNVNYMTLCNFKAQIVKQIGDETSYEAAFTFV